MNCKQVQRQLVSYINGELEEKEEEEFVRTGSLFHCFCRYSAVGRRRRRD